VKIQKGVRARLERALSTLNRSLKVLEKAQGIAIPIHEWTNGADYVLINPKCTETCSNLAVNVRVHAFVGSEAVMAWTARDILEGLLNEAES